MALHVTKSGIMIVPYHKGKYSQLEMNNSTFDKVYYKWHERSGFIVPYDEHQECYLTYYRNPSIFEHEEIIYESISPYCRMDNDGMRLTENISPTELQSYVIEQIIGGQSTDDLKSNQWFLNLPTASGKTLTSLYFASLVKYKTLIICPNSNILNQWVKTLEEKFDFDMYYHSVFTSGKDLDHILYSFSPETRGLDIFFCTGALLNTFGKRHGWSALKILFEKLRIGLIIIDEAHLHLGFTIRMCASTNVKYTLFLSADYGRGNYKDEKNFLCTFEKTPLIQPTEKQMESFRNTVVFVVEFSSHPTSMERENAIYNRYGYSSELYIKYQIKKGVIFQVLKYVVSIIDETNESEDQIVILCTNIDPVDEIAYHLGQYFPNKKIIRFHGEVPDEEKNQRNKADIIVSTYSSFSTGIDMKRVRYVIGTNQSNKIEDNQSGGRAGRTSFNGDNKEVYYFMLIDGGFKYCKNKLEDRLRYLKTKKVKKIYRMKFDQ